MNANTESENRREGVHVETQDLPDGKRVVRRYEHGVLVTEFHFETLASGKQIRREFDGSNTLQRETQSYGMLDIGVQFNFLKGKKTGETYFVRKKLAARRSYQRARSKYSDMPPPDVSFRDFGGELQRMIAAERKTVAAARQSHIPDPERASENDEFCRERISAGTCLDAQIWLRSGNHTLGEMNQAESRRLLSRLARYGAVRILACQIDDYGEQGQNTGHLVIELPNEDTPRMKLLKAIARIAELRGFSGDADDGQDYAYFKLD